MSSLTNINNNSSVVNVGRTTPVTPGQKPSSKSIPVVLASDQTPIPVVEQNKIQSEVALSLLGIPRSEVALGIFADVNTYDVNPNEWSSTPSTYTSGTYTSGFKYGHGVKHIQEEAGALIEAPRNESSVLTSKRFFRYQPGRVSAATFGVKSTVSISSFAQNPVIRKYGIFDKYDGYYWETRQNGKDDNFAVVRRTNSLYRTPASIFGLATSLLKGPSSTSSDTLGTTQLEDYRVVGKSPNSPKPSSTRLLKDRKIISDSRYKLMDATWTELMTNSLYSTFATYYNGLSTFNKIIFKNKCLRDSDYWIDMYLMDIEFNCDAHTSFNTKNYETSLAYNNGAAPYEIILYNALKAVINSEPTYHSGLTSKEELVGLVDITIAFFAAVHASTGNNAAFTGPTSYPTLKSRIETMFDVRRQYWAYYTNEYDSNGNALLYDDMPAGYLLKFGATTDKGSWNAEANSPNLSDTSPNLLTAGWYYKVVGTASARDIGNGEEIFNVDDIVLYTGTNWIKISKDIIKDKCIRDMLYVIDGYRDDLIGGGNAATKYNASMYYTAYNGYKANSTNDMTVYSQLDGVLPAEIARHIHLRSKIVEDLANTYFVGTVNTTINSKFYTVNDNTSLANIIVTNFSKQDTNVTEYGDRGVAGNLVILRDGLIMVNAAVYDPALLKPKNKIVATTTLNSTFKITSGVVTFDQHVRYFGPTLSIGVSPALPKVVSGKLYQVARVIGPKGNEFTIKDSSGVEITFDSTAPIDGITFQTVNPFIFPKSYDPAVYRVGVTPNYTEGNDPFPDGMVFPYKYTSNGSLPRDPNDITIYEVGYIDTAITTDINHAVLEEQIDSVNFTQEYINWIKNNVDPEYYGVYEYRVPRSRYSNDQLNGVQLTDNVTSGNPLVYSDFAIGNTGRAYPGQAVKADAESLQTRIASVYNFDFTKVTMLKIEFSWYGAVGALFLAYVPVSNGEARWVRVHHLRASNQLKIASLGNATLPITYNVYGGGDSNTKGSGEIDQNLGYERSSHYIVKYGASYYIDGGDRGTVRLYSNDNTELEDVYGRTYNVSSGTYNANDTLFTIQGIPSINTSVSALNDLPDNAFFMGAKVKTNNRTDQNIKVIWVDTTKIYLSSAPLGTSIRLIPDRGNTIYGLETKENIVSTQNKKIRNRVQVYPTQLSAVNLGSVPIRVRLKKTPIFQTEFVTTGSFSLTSIYEITSDKNPLPTISTTYLEDGGSTYGWFRGLLEETENITVFGKLYRIGTEYYFDMIDSYVGKIQLVAQSFLRERRFSSTGVELQTSDIKILTEKEGLSSVKIAVTNQVPVPATGINIATLYIQPGTEQIDMATYFDYNKEYLSYPLTNVADTLYFVVDAEGDVNIASPTSVATVGIGLTWEEQ
jgi:hypothetical protein